MSTDYEARERLNGYPADAPLEKYGAFYAFVDREEARMLAATECPYCDEPMASEPDGMCENCRSKS